jgi:hypothetical protein
MGCESSKPSVALRRPAQDRRLLLRSALANDDVERSSLTSRGSRGSRGSRRSSGSSKKAKTVPLDIVVEVVDDGKPPKHAYEREVHNSSANKPALRRSGSESQLSKNVRFQRTDTSTSKLGESANHGAASPMVESASGALSPNESAQVTPELERAPADADKTKTDPAKEKDEGLLAIE